MVRYCQTGGLVLEKMEKHRTVFERMLDDEIRGAFIERKRSSYNVSEEELEELESYILSDECTNDIKRLQDREFFFDIPVVIRLRKKNSTRRRTVYKYRDNERALLKLMAFVMHDYDYLYPDSLYSFRIGKHVSEIFREVNRRGYNRTHWVLKADIHSYGDFVDPEILMGQLGEIFAGEDPGLLWFFGRLLLRGEYYEKGVLKRGSTGALSGCALTNFFENVYLLDVDDMVLERADYYCRFADDIAVFVKTEQEANDIRNMLEAEFAGRGLAFNEDKTAVTGPGESFELLGFQLQDGHFDIAYSSRSKIEWKLKHYANRLVRRQRKNGLPREVAERFMIKRIDRYFFGHERFEHELNWVDWSFDILTRPDSLRHIDACAQDCIRIVGSGGKRGDARYRIRYKDMKKHGYRSLVHVFYHGLPDDEEAERVTG